MTFKRYCHRCGRENSTYNSYCEFCTQNDIIEKQARLDREAADRRATEERRDREKQAERDRIRQRDEEWLRNKELQQRDLPPYYPPEGIPYDKIPPTYFGNDIIFNDSPDVEVPFIEPPTFWETLTNRAQSAFMSGISAVIGLVVVVAAFLAGPLLLIAVINFFGK